MFKGYQDTRKVQQFKGFPALNHQMNNEAYGFSGCIFDLDARYGLNTQANLAAISYWKDKIRNLEFAQATAGSQPRLILSDPDFNNLPSVDFSVDMARRLVSILGISVPMNFTVAAVAKYNAANNTNTIIGSDANGPNSERIVLGGTNTGVNGAAYTAGTTVYLSATSESATPKIVVGNNNEIVVNGVSEVTGSDKYFNDVFNQVGTTNNSTTAQLRGKISRILFFGRKFLSDELIMLSDRINIDYAIY